MNSVPVPLSLTALLFLVFTAQAVVDVAFCLPDTAARIS
jgi:hypothetical protein